MIINTKARGPSVALLALGVSLLAASAHAVGLVYVDADDDFNGGGANANIAPLSAFDTSGTVNRNDGLWHLRDGFGFEGPEFNFIWEATGNVDPDAGDTGEDVQEVTQTISGLTPGASYTAYAVYWATAESWVIRAGTSSGDLTLYDAFGVQPDATAGVPAASAIWESPPTIAGAPAFTEDDRTAYLGLAGTVEADGAGEALVYIDDLPGDSSGTRTWFDGVAYLPAEFGISPTAAIDRDTGEFTLSNNTGAPISFTSFSLTSASQALDASSWLSISDNYDEGADGGVDDDAWEVTAPLDSPLPAFAGELSEMESEGGADGATLADGASIDLGAVWQDTRFEDVQVALALTSGTTLTIPATYAGTEHLLGDFSNDGAVGLEDYETFTQNLHTDTAGLGQAEAYLLGDMNGDIQINHDDFLAFRDAYDAANGAGAFAAAIGVPEPGGLALLAGWACALLGLRRQRRRPAPAFAPARAGAIYHTQKNLTPRASTMRIGLHPRAFTCAALLCGLTLMAARPAAAQLTYVDADATEGTGNTTPGSAFLAGSDNSADDDLWSLRTGFASGGTIYESGQGDGEDAPEISTVIDGLTPDALYSVYVHFWDGSGGDPDWNVRGGFNSGALTPFANPADAPDIDAQDALLASDLDYATAPTVFAEADRTMYAGLLGPAKADSSGQLQVFADDLPSTIGVNQRTWYDGVSFEPATVLALRVATNGQVSIVNENAAADFDINYYEVRSPSGSLDLDGWASIDGEGAVGETTWEKAGGSSANLISETNLLGTESFDPSASVSLGGAFAGGQQDLEFYYSLTGGDGQLLRGFVEFVTVEGLPGDFNADNVVDAADYAVWRDNLGRSVTLPNDNGLGSPVGSQHYDLWRSSYGTTSASAGGAQSAPEPGALGLVLAAATPLALRRRRARRADALGS